MQCPIDENCDGFVVEKIVVFCYTHNRLKFDGRIWIPLDAAQPSVERMGLLARLFKWLAQIAHR